MPDEPSSDRKGGFLAFWTTLPGILTGLAALITAIVGAVGLWKSQSGGGDNGGVQAPVVATTDITGVSHQLSLPPGDGADLEKGQIGSLVNTDLAFGPESTPTLRAGASTFFAPVEGTPNKARSAAALSSRHDTSEIVSQVERSWVCMSTEGKVAGVRIIKAPGVGSAKLVLAYVIWP
jgi:hypothetical protein